MFPCGWILGAGVQTTICVLGFIGLDLKSRVNVVVGRKAHPIPVMKSELTDVPRHHGHLQCLDLHRNLRAWQQSEIGS